MKSFTEANIQGIRAARNVQKKENPNIVIPKTAHFSFEKIGDILGVKIRRAGVDEDYKVDLGQVEDLKVIETTDKVFNKEALAALSKFRYAPTIRDGERIKTKGVLHKVTFKMGR